MIRYDSYNVIYNNIIPDLPSITTYKDKHNSDEESMSIEFTSPLTQCDIPNMLTNLR